MNIEQALGKIFDEVTSDLQRNLDLSAKGELTSQLRAGLRGSGAINVDFQLDGNGHYSTTINKYGAGKTVHLTGKIESPNDIWDITIKSSDGGGGTWRDIATGQMVSCHVNTIFWHNTDITVELQARNSKNTSGKAVIDYSY